MSSSKISSSTTSIQKILVEFSASAKSAVGINASCYIHQLRLTHLETFAVLINHKLLAKTPIETFIYHSSNQYGESLEEFLQKDLGTYLLNHVQNLRRAPRQIPTLINTVVKELLLFASPQSELPTLRDQYQRDIVRAMTCQKDEFVNHCITQGVSGQLLFDHESTGRKEKDNWNGEKVIVTQYLSATAAIGDLDLVLKYINQGGQVFKDEGVFPSPSEAAASTGLSEILKLFLTFVRPPLERRTDGGYKSGSNEFYRNAYYLEDVLWISIKARQPATAILLFDILAEIV